MIYIYIYIYICVCIHMIVLPVLRFPIAQVLWSLDFLGVPRFCGFHHPMSKV